MPVAPQLAAPTGPGPSSFSRQRLRTSLITVGGLAAVTAAVVAFDPVHHHVPLCPLHAATGIWCPFCGGLRAVWLLAHLDVRAALASNLVLFVAAPWFAWRWWRGLTGRPPLTPAWRGRPLPAATITVIVIVLLVAYTVVRNLPAGSFLAPAS